MTITKLSAVLLLVAACGQKPAALSSASLQDVPPDSPAFQLAVGTRIMPLRENVIRVAPHTARSVLGGSCALLHEPSDQERILLWDKALPVKSVSEVKVPVAYDLSDCSYWRYGVKLEIVAADRTLLVNCYATEVFTSNCPRHIFTTPPRPLIRDLAAVFLLQQPRPIDF